MKFYPTLLIFTTSQVIYITSY